MRSKPAKQLLGLIGVAVCIFAAVWLRNRPDAPRAEREAGAATEIDRARAELARARYQRVRDLTRGILEREPGNDDALLLLAEADSKDGDLAGALQAYQNLLSHSSNSENRKIAYQCAGEILLQQGRAATSERYFREALKIDPYFAKAHNRLAFKQGLEGRRWESQEHLFELIKLDRFSELHLLLLANPRPNLMIEDYVQTVISSGEPYPVIRLPEAKQLIRRGMPDEAWPIVREILEYDPNQIEAKMLQGELLTLDGRREEFVEWSRSLTLVEERHPACWLLRGQWCLAQHRLKEAVRCFAEAFFRDPNSIPACKHLAQLLPRFDEKPEIVDYFTRRAPLLDDFEADAEILYINQKDVNLILKCYAYCDQLERFWEAWGWLRVALDVDPDNAIAQRELDSLEPDMESDLPRTILFRGQMDWNYRTYPLPEWYGSDASQEPDLNRSAGGRIEFQDVASELGLNFAFQIGKRFDDEKDGYFYMHQMSGGGVAAVDYDRNGLPDLYFAQGAADIEPPWNPAETDRLFRNLAGTGFRDVTEAAGIRELSYSQGVNSGDVDNDGFPDLYVGNIGGNVLFLNNGDGTFRKSEDPLFAASSVWTASVAVADLDGDSIPDLYDVNYLQPEGYYRLCDSGNGIMRACSPRIIPAERDRLLRGRGDGTFEDVSSALPESANEGRGLGILVADILDRGETQVFVANDTIANNLYQFSRAADSKQLTVRDEAVLTGLAFDANGRAQACMGIAMADFDLNQTEDLFVTNFYGDYNTVYIQDKAIGLFVDLSHSSNMASLSNQLLAFGTQTIDPDLDGNPDLFVANGHVDDFRFKDLPFRMRPQLIRNVGKARFEELTADEVGLYFQRELLGRAVAKLDFNGDRREDLVVTHLETPPALLKNRSAPVGRPLVLTFVGTSDSRDVVGARLRLEQASRSYVSQVTLGSGYFAANENQVVFPVLDDAEIVLTVTWPSGEESTYSLFKPDTKYCIIQDSGGAVEIP